jgi:hypothetical protein
MAKCNKDQVEHLQKALKHEKDSTVRQRIQMILLREDVELLAIDHGWKQENWQAMCVRLVRLPLNCTMHSATCLGI